LLQVHDILVQNSQLKKEVKKNGTAIQQSGKTQTSLGLSSQEKSKNKGRNKEEIRTYSRQVLQS
jgi:hypothetical protein